MTTPNQLRQSIRDYFRSNIRIDNLGLNKPESIRDINKPPSIGIDLSFDNFQIEESFGVGIGKEFNISTNIGFQIIFRLDNSYRYTDIPRGIAENVLLSVLLDLNNNDCIDRDINSLDASGKIIVQEESNNDWIIIFDFTLEINFHTSFTELSREEKTFFV